MFILCIELMTLTVRQRGFYSYVYTSRPSLTSYTSTSHALRAIAEVHRHGRHAPAPRPALAGFLGAMTITVAAVHHLTQNIKVIPQTSGSFSQHQSWSSSNWASSSTIGAMRRSTDLAARPSVGVSDGCMRTGPRTFVCNGGYHRYS